MYLEYFANKNMYINTHGIRSMAKIKFQSEENEVILNCVYTFSSCTNNLRLCKQNLKATTSNFLYSILGVSLKYEFLGN